MGEIMGVALSEYRWRPYPAKNMQETEVFSLSPEEVKELTTGRRTRANTIKAEYTGKIHSHRTQNGSNYHFLKDVLQNWNEKKDGPTDELKRLLEDHGLKERTIGDMSKNLAFKAAAYAFCLLVILL